MSALDGVTYAASAQGRLLAVGTPRWDRFARNHGAAGPERETVLGRELFDYLSGEEVRDAYRRIHAHVLAGRPHVAFEYRCDAPDVRRTMRMSISLLELPQTEPMVLYQSQVLSEVERPWISLFEPERILQWRRSEYAFPVVTVCSFCLQVRLPDEAGGRWVEPEAYYARGAPHDVRVSHGLCATCGDRNEQMLADVEPTAA